jgi:hypothetical protein
MHGLINRALQTFVCQTYGDNRWRGIAEAAGLGFTEFEAMLTYEDDLTANVLNAICADLGRPQAEVLEDFGTYLVSNPHVEALRRLLRFGGVTYVEFLHSLDDLPDRTQLAVADLILPRLELREYIAGQFKLTCGPGLPGFGRIMMGVLRTMADDYGALVLLDYEGMHNEAEVITITLIETAFAQGRSFELGARAG